MERKDGKQSWSERFLDNDPPVTGFECHLVDARKMLLTETLSDLSEEPLTTDRVELARR